MAPLALTPVFVGLRTGLHVLFVTLSLLVIAWAVFAPVDSRVVVVAIWALGGHGEWTVVGPLVGAGVALLIGLGYQALAREAAQREDLMRELIATRGQLAR